MIIVHDENFPKRSTESSTTEGPCMNAGEVLTVAEVMSRFDSEWVLLGDAKTDEKNQLVEGNLLWHSKDRDEVYRKAIELHPPRFATIFTGTLPKDMALVL